MNLKRIIFAASRRVLVKRTPSVVAAVYDRRRTCHTLSAFVGGHRPPLQATRRRASGFSLPELVVSMAILAILSLFLVTMLNQVSKSWGMVKAQIDTRQTGRSILTLIASDLRVAALPKDRSNLNSLQFLVDPVNSTTYPSASFTANNAAATAAGTYLYPHAFFWQAPIASDTTYGNMAEVGYFIRWDTTTNANNPRAMLCRYFVNPSALNPAGTAVQQNPNYLIYSNLTTGWLLTTTDGTGANASGTGYGSLDTVAPLPVAATTKSLSQPYQGWVADNVIGLWIRCLDAAGNPITLQPGTTSPFNGLPGTGTANGAVGQSYYAYDSRKGYAIVAPTISTACLLKNVVNNGNNIQRALVWATLPPVVEIAIVVLDGPTAARVSSISTTSPTSFQAYGSSSIYNLLPNGTQASVGTPLNPTNFWAEINAFYNALPTTIRHGARIYSTRVQLVNGN